MESAEMNMFGTGGGFGGGRGLGGSGGRDTVSMPQTLGQPTTNAVPASANPSQGASASAGDCHYFLQGTCTKVSGLCHLGRNHFRYRFLQMIHSVLQRLSIGFILL